jgi:hypothetical protein
MGQNKENTPSKLHQIQCIWMDAGVVRYKLCGAGFDCENCLFDKVMKNDDFEKIRFHHEKSSFRENDLIEQKIEAVKEAGLSKGNIYLKNNLMIKKLLGKTYYLGLTPLAYTLLENIAGFNYCRDNTAIRRGDPLVQFISDWGSIKILSPLNFYCLGRLKQELNDVSSKEWFSLVELEPDQLQHSQISEDQYLSNCSAIETIFNRFKADFPDIGTTLNDGGEKLRYLYQIIGNKRYYTVVEKLFSHS